MIRWHKQGKYAFLIPLILAVVTGLWSEGIGSPPSTAQASGCWQAAITEQWPDLDLAGSVLRVGVQGMGGLPVRVRSEGGFVTTNTTGTKPEYGPNVAEFAPLSKGVYFIEPQGLGLTFEVFLDGKNYTRVDFTRRPCAPTATPTATPTRPAATATRPATATPTAALALPSPAPTQPSPSGGWQGRVVEHLRDLEGRYYATIAVRVIGRPAGQEVGIQAGSFAAGCKTGTKPEIAPDACEFGGLNAGTYTLTPRDLGASLDVTVGLRDFVLVEFSYTGPTPKTHWVGSVVENSSGSTPTEYTNSAIAVIVAGRPWHEVEIRAGEFVATCTTGIKPDIDPAACEFGGLRAGTYTLTPRDLGLSLQVTVDGQGWALVRFDEVRDTAPPPPTATPQPPSPTARPAVTPPGPTLRPTAQPTATPPGPTSTPRPGWQGWIIRNSSGQSGGTGVASIVIVRVINYGGVPVHISGGGSWSDTCITGTKPEFGPDACSFGGLWAGTYTLWPEGSDFRIEIEMDGIGTAEVHFAPP